MAHAPEQGHNHNLDSVALNYPCPVSRLKVISHSRTKYRENETREQKYFMSIMPMQVYNTPLGFTCGFAASPEVGPGATVGTLQAGYPRVQALSQDEGQDVRSHVPICP
jgi:hypothetical protein